MQEIVLPNFPLKQQLDNELAPAFTCNMTSLAMCLIYLNAARCPGYNEFSQFEDELTERCLDRGLNRESPDAIREMAELYGVSDDLHIVEGWEAIGKVIYKLIAHLKANNPAIVHTYLTASGHVICIDGVRLDDNGKPVQWRCADPYGEYFPDGYSRNYGSDLMLGRYWLSHKAFTRCVLTDAIFWVHLLSK